MVDALKIITVGDERLRDCSAEIAEFNGYLHDLVENMFETMHRGNGIGLAGVQVGQLIRVFITDVPQDTRRVFINPELVYTSVEEVTLEEGCLSIPQKYAEVIRPEAVTIQAFNEKGRPFTCSAEDMLARVILHELDHLNGVLFIDHISERRKNQILKSFL
ncbi:MAG: peptide deformylase [Spirochaetales bacterium]|nr:peptide deformylase [Spirochaetales bacterium]